MTIKHYPKLTTEFIETKVFLKYVKKFLNNINKELNLNAKISVDKFGIGSGPIYQMCGETFNLRIYSSSFGSSDKMGNCYVVMQPICPCMKQPYDMGVTINRSLAYYVNNPKYLIKELTRVKNENKLWGKIKPYLLKEKHLKNPEKYFDTIEKSVEAIDEILEDSDILSHSRLTDYHNLLKTCFLTLKQKRALKKEIVIKSKEVYKNNDIIPVKTFDRLAEKKEAKIIGKKRKCFYDKKNEILYTLNLSSIDFVRVPKKCYAEDYKDLLKIDDLKAYTEIFAKRKTAFLLTSKIYLR